ILHLSTLLNLGTNSRESCFLCCSFILLESFYFPIGAYPPSTLLTIPTNVFLFALISG
uniref:Uncharacterized protein n=1 Tax=Aegilops tauschii subsp. strangulata TaxID=200361 RepID=A0A453C1N0_AEGTS